MTLDQIDQMILEVGARLKTLKKLRRLKLKEADLSKEIR